MGVTLHRSIFTFLCSTEELMLRPAIEDGKSSTVMLPTPPLFAVPRLFVPLPPFPRTHVCYVVAGGGGVISLVTATQRRPGRPSPVLRRSRYYYRYARTAAGDHREGWTLRGARTGALREFLCS